MKIPTTTKAMSYASSLESSGDDAACSRFDVFKRQNVDNATNLFLLREVGIRKYCDLSAQNDFMEYVLEPYREFAAGHWKEIKAIMRQITLINNVDLFLSQKIPLGIYTVMSDEDNSFAVCLNPEVGFNFERFFSRFVRASLIEGEGATEAAVIDSLTSVLLSAGCSFDPSALVGTWHPLPQKKTDETVEVISRAFSSFAIAFGLAHEVSHVCLNHFDESAEESDKKALIDELHADVAAVEIYKKMTIFEDTGIAEIDNILKSLKKYAPIIFFLIQKAFGEKLRDVIPQFYGTHPDEEIRIGVILDNLMDDCDGEHDEMFAGIAFILKNFLASSD